MGLKKYQILEINQKVLEDILSGKIRKFESVQKYQSFHRKANETYVSSMNYLMLYKWVFDERINDYITIIETIFKK